MTQEAYRWEGGLRTYDGGRLAAVAACGEILKKGTLHLPILLHCYCHCHTYRLPTPFHSPGCGLA